MRKDLDRMQKTVDAANGSTRIPDSELRSKMTIHSKSKSKGNKSKFKEKTRSTIEVHDIEGKNKDKKIYLDTYSKTKNGKEKIKEFFAKEGERGSIQKTNKKGKTKERKTTKGGTKRRIARAEKNLEDI